MAYGDDTTKFISFSDEVSGTTKRVSTSNPFPVTSAGGGGTSDASAANQVTGNNSLASIDTNQGAKADAVASSDTGTFSLIALIKRLVSKIPGVGANTTANSLPVTIASDQTLNIGTMTPGIAATNLGKAEDSPHASGDTGIAVWGVRADAPVTNVSTAGDYTSIQSDPIGRLWVNSTYANVIDAAHSHFRNTAISNTAVAVKAGVGNLYGFQFVNLNTIAVYVKLYNVAQGSVTVGTTAPVKIFVVPAATDANNPGGMYVAPDDTPLYYASAAITIACVTGISDNNSTAPTTAIYAEVIYK